MNEVEFTTMVNFLLKPGADIIASLTPEKIDLLHATIGVVGEGGEVVAALQKDDRENLVEEIGDTNFYADKIYTITGIVRRGYSEYSDANPCEIDYFILVADLLDLVKKYVVYNKPLDVDSLTVKLDLMEYFLFCVGEEYKISRQETLDYCANKLSVRYAGGYSDQAAQTRADKPEGQ